MLVRADALTQEYPKSVFDIAHPIPSANKASPPKTRHDRVNRYSAPSCISRDRGTSLPYEPSLPRSIASSQHTVDVRYALRVLLRTPGLTAVAILSLALGIGANVTIYAIANAFLDQPIAGAHDVDRLVRIYRGDHSPLQYADLERVRAEKGVFSDVAGERMTAVAVTIGADIHRVQASLVTDGYFRMLEAQPELGRFFAQSDSIDTAPVIVISHAFWRDHLCFVQVRFDLNQLAAGFNQVRFSQSDIFRTRAEFETAVLGMRAGQANVQVRRGGRTRDLVVDVPQFTRTAQRNAVGHRAGDRIEGRSASQIDQPQNSPAVPNVRGTAGERGENR